MSAKVILTVTDGQLKGKQFSFDSRDTCLIGRSNKCQIQLPSDQDHNTISRYHCFLDINPPDVRICDSGSRNGTYVNDRCIGKRSQDQTPSEGANLSFDECDLKDGDEVKLGNTVFQVKIEEELPPTLDEELPPTFDIEAELNKMPPPIPIESDGNLGILDNYIKLQQLGFGGFGEVYLARHQTTGELVAIKTLLPQVLVKPHMKERFLREARNTKQLNHPHLVKFQDHGYVNNIFYFVMEYCERGSVMDLIKYRKGTLTIKEATKITLQVLDGLHYAHTEKKLVHRDIKPGNIFLTEKDGELIAKLGDYGLAKSFDLAGLSGQTATGAKMGTFQFMPKQQVMNFKYAQPDVDIWAVAASLYSMLTLKLPRDFSEDENPMFAVLKTKPVPIRQRSAAIPQSLAEVIDLALDDEGDLYFQDALSFKNALIEAIST